MFDFRQQCHSINILLLTEGKGICGANWKDTTEDEFMCLLGLLILSGVYKSRSESIIQLWNLEDGRAIFGRSMARALSQQLSHSIRFDDAANRREHRIADKFAPIRKVFDMWGKTLNDSFVPGENVTVDEQLLTYHGYCPFKQFIRSKPGKYGIKLWMLCDSATSYILRLQVHTGRARTGSRTESG